MKNKIVLLASIALAGSLVACGGNSSAPATSGSTPAATSSSSSATAPAASSDASSSSSEQVKKEVALDKYERIFNYFSGSEYDFKSIFYGLEEEHGKRGPNYSLALTLEKEGNKAVFSRKIVYMPSKSDPIGFLNSEAGGFSVEGTWVKNGDGTYKVNLPEYEVKRGTGDNYPAVELVSDANGDIVVKYAYGTTKQGEGEGEVTVNKEYETKMYTQPSFEGEYQGTYFSITDRDDGLDSTVAEEKQFEEVVVEASPKDAGDKVIYDVSGAIEDSGISAFEGNVDVYGVYVGETPRLDGTCNGIFYKDATSGATKFAWHMEARERLSVVCGEIL